MNSMTEILDAPRAGLADDMTEDDNRRGYERDETDRAFRQLVDHLVVDGDDRARSAGRQARRTLAEMDPGYQRQPVLLLARPLDFRPTDEAPQTLAAPLSNSGQQCDTCGTWFGYAGWTCAACQQLQGAALPMRPTPHERDGRTEPTPEPARPHAAVPVRHQP
ncbi:hypothetical protein [Streptomyces nitrosporeus]|uniref:hypothetical protein n=1 Tax=Streptomyces nitrosporeus TaxID=28894 RepID=UPI00198972BE|nr:hypothetical protein [Streptomyces nitrosporeus]GGZ29531.1 hypothetical protein GCM10010327_69780 [Streptomyces nitrosporeus]